MILNLEWIKEHLPHVLETLNEDDDDGILLKKITRQKSQQTDLRADGDAHLGDVDFNSFQVPKCERCVEGLMKPNVVFFRRRNRQVTVLLRRDCCRSLADLGSRPRMCAGRS